VPQLRDNFFETEPNRTSFAITENVEPVDWLCSAFRNGFVARFGVGECILLRVRRSTSSFEEVKSVGLADL
jgi:hypothetical protein